MKIMFLASPASIHTLRWVNELAKRGHEVHLVFEQTRLPVLTGYQSEVVMHRLPYVGKYKRLLNIYALRKLYQRLRPDVVNAHYATVYGLLVRLSRIGGNYVLSVWGSDVYLFPYTSRRNKKIVIKNLTYADKIASTSKAMARQVNRLLTEDGKSAREITITPFGVDLDLFDPKSYCSIQQSDVVTIGLVKSLKDIYAIDDFLQIIGIVRNRIRGRIRMEESLKIRVSIYGEGSQLEYLSKISEKLGLRDIVTFCGHIDYEHVPQALKELDIFLITSIQESFGVAAVEAMAMELPVVASDAEGFLEVIDDGETGYIVKNRDLNEFADKLIELVESPYKRERMGKKGREKVAKFFNFSDNVTVMEECYQR